VNKNFFILGFEPLLPVSLDGALSIKLNSQTGDLVAIMGKSFPKS